MKIICIGRNYSEHARELNNPLPKKPVFFMKPDSALLLRNKPFFYPDFSSEVHYETEVVLKISRLGKSIQRQFASRYYQTVGLGIDFTARDLQDECKKAGHPWEIAKAFDQSAVINIFVPLDTLPDRNALNFQLEINDKTVQKGNTKDMIFSFDEIIAYVSTFITLKTGDLIFTGTPAGVGPVKQGDHLVASLEGRVMLDFHIR
ncbi:MAG: fumarylacetoacetate hydrolase family protein [Bacteroidales bacterium]|nr:fumarylacetoacetate hydrolase family protein [Bacteroidales bacterium]